MNSQGQKASVPYTENSVKLTRKDLKVGRWLKVNITTMVSEFFRLPRENLAIVVRVQDSTNRMSLVVPHPSSESNHALVSLHFVLFLKHYKVLFDLKISVFVSSCWVFAFRYSLLVAFVIRLINTT